jgi:hypothetical protein
VSRDKVWLRVCEDKTLRRTALDEEMELAVKTGQPIKEAKHGNRLRDGVAKK